MEYHTNVFFFYNLTPSKLILDKRNGNRNHKFSYAILYYSGTVLRDYSSEFV